MDREELKERIELLRLSVIESEHEIKRYTISKKENEEELEKLEKRLNKLEKKPPLALWKPEVGERFYHCTTPRALVARTLVVHKFWENNSYDNIAFESGNISPTEKLAELKRDIRLATEEYKRKVAEFNGDWRDVYQRKYYLLLTFGEIRDNWTTSAYEPEKEGYYFSGDVADNEQQLSKLKELYQKIINLTKEYKKAEKEWRNDK